MRAITVVDPGPQSKLLMSDQPEPKTGEGEVLIRVRAAGVNRADLLQRAGKYPPPPGAPEILGLEVAGAIERIGPNVTGWSVGDEVCALLTGGGYAEKVSVPAGQLMRVPKGVSLAHAAAIPEAFITAFTNLEHEARLRPNEKVLIHGGSSGVGTAAIQLARCVGAFVAVTVANDQKASRCRELGAVLAVNYRQEDFATGVRAWSPDGVDVILDSIGRDYMERNVSLLAPRGRLVCIAAMSGAIAEVDISLLIRRRLTIIGSVLRGRSIAEKAALVAAFSERYIPLFELKRISPVVHSVLPFTEAQEAHDTMRGSEHIGKIVLEWR